MVTLVMLASLVPLYGTLGFIPRFTGRVGGLATGSSSIVIFEAEYSRYLPHTAGEMYALAIYFGAVYGAFQAYARAVFSELIPHSQEARWYGLYSITDKVSGLYRPH